MLVVVVVLGLLSVVGMLAMGGQGRSGGSTTSTTSPITMAASATAQTEFAQIRTAIGLYVAVNPDDSYTSLGADPVPVLRTAGLVDARDELCTYTLNNAVSPAVLTQGGPGAGCSAMNTASL
jgi:hypothetical protein